MHPQNLSLFAYEEKLNLSLDLKIPKVDVNLYTKPREILWNFS